MSQGIRYENTARTKQRLLAASFQFCQNLLGNFFERLKNSGALECNRFDDRFVLLAQLGAEEINREDVWQVALLQLQDVRNLVEVVAVLFQVRHQVVERLDVGVLPLLLRISHEDD